MAGKSLDESQIQAFIDDGFVRIDDAFSRETAEEAGRILWRDSGCDPHDATTWTRPVIRLNGYGGPPFSIAVNTPVLLDAFDKLVGKGRWQPRNSLGTFPLRFPSSIDPGDAGWHIDVSFQGDAAPDDYFSWRANVFSQGRALLMLFLFSDVGEDDAPTRIRVGSHLDMAKRLAPAGEAGLTLNELAATGFSESAHRAEAIAAGLAGTVYLCHPFLVHSAQPHRGTRPRFMAQPPLYPAEPLQLERADGAYCPVEQAIRKAVL